MPHTPNYTEAAIRLRIPASGDPKLDDMIHEARRLDIATAAMVGSMVRHWPGEGTQFEPLNIAKPDHLQSLAEGSFAIADAMLKESEL